MYGVGETVEERSQASKPHSVKSMTFQYPAYRLMEPYQILAFASMLRFDQLQLPKYKQPGNSHVKCPIPFLLKGEDYIATSCVAEGDKYQTFDLDTVLG